MVNTNRENTNNQYQEWKKDNTAGFTGILRRYQGIFLNQIYANNLKKILGEIKFSWKIQLAKIDI